MSDSPEEKPVVRWTSTIDIESETHGSVRLGLLPLGRTPVGASPLTRRLAPAAKSTGSAARAPESGGCDVTARRSHFRPVSSARSDSCAPLGITDARAAKTTSSAARTRFVCARAWREQALAGEEKRRSECFRTNRCDRQPTNLRSKLELSRPVPTRAEEENQPSDPGP